MRNVLTILVAVFAHSTGATIVYAQSMEDARLLGSWFGEVVPIRSTGTQILNNAIETELIIADLVDGSISKDAAVPLIDSRLKEHRRSIRRYADSQTSIPVLESAYPPFVTVTEEFLDYIYRIPNFLQQYAGYVEGMYLAVLDDDLETYESISAKTSGRLIFLLEGENEFLKVSLIIAPKGHPQRPLVRSNIETNKSLMELLRFSELVFSNHEFDAELTSVEMYQLNANAAEQVDTLEETNTDFWNRYKSSNQFSKKQKVLFDEMESSYLRSAETERKIIDALNEVADSVKLLGDLINEDATDGEISSLQLDMNRNADLVDTLSAQRSVEYDIRRDLGLKLTQ